MITLAIDRYDRHMPFFDGTVSLTGGPKIHVMQVGQTGALRDGSDRHERMLRDLEFDAAETSLASYIVARSKGLPFTGIPVFPRRLFSHGQMFVNADAGIETPKDLEGKTVGLQSFQTTLAVLAKGDLATEYDVSLTTIKWRVASQDAVEIKNDNSYDIKPLNPGQSLPELLCRGEIDALFFSRTPQPRAPLAGKFHHLFGDPRREERRFFGRNGYWPIMHIIALKIATVDAHPDLPGRLITAFNEAYDVSSEYLNDPNWTRSPWQKYIQEEEQQAFTHNLWASGVMANRDNLERFLGYVHSQGLIDRPLEIPDLFHESVIDT